MLSSLEFSTENDIIYPCMEILANCVAVYSDNVIELINGSLDDVLIKNLKSCSPNIFDSIIYVITNIIVENSSFMEKLINKGIWPILLLQY